jgi:hypothetical protein
MDLEDETIEDLEEYKTNFQELMLEYRQLRNFCEEIQKSINTQNYYDFYLELKETLKDFYENIDPDYKFFYKKLDLKFFVKHYYSFTSKIKDISEVNICGCEEDIEEIEERLMTIGNEIFPILPKPEENLNYQKQKKFNQLKRELIYGQFEKKYEIKSEKIKIKNSKEF